MNYNNYVIACVDRQGHYLKLIVREVNGIVQCLQGYLMSCKRIPDIKGFDRFSLIYVIIAESKVIVAVFRICLTSPVARSV